MKDIYIVSDVHGNYDGYDQAEGKYYLHRHRREVNGREPTILKLEYER